MYCTHLTLPSAWSDIPDPQPHAVGLPENGGSYVRLVPTIRNEVSLESLASIPRGNSRRQGQAKSHMSSPLNLKCKFFWDHHSPKFPSHLATVNLACYPIGAFGAATLGSQWFEGNG